MQEPKKDLFPDAAVMEAGKSVPQIKEEMFYLSDG
jgi:hypothetical protein